MTEAAVIDASAVAALAFAEEEGVDVRRWIAGRPLVAPSLLPYELMNVAAKKIRHHPDQSPKIRQALAWALGDDFLVVWHKIDAGAIFGLAVETRLTPYDASYLWLAKRLGAELITLDTALAEAARRVL